jgi:hypothetical protein
MHGVLIQCKRGVLVNSTCKGPQKICEAACIGTLTLVLVVFYPGNPVYSGHAKIINTQNQRVEKLLLSRSLALHSNQEQYKFIRQNLKKTIPSPVSCLKKRTLILLKFSMLLNYRTLNAF